MFSSISLTFGVFRRKKSSASSIDRSFSSCGIVPVGKTEPDKLTIVATTGKSRVSGSSHSFARIHSSAASDNLRRSAVVMADDGTGTPARFAIAYNDTSSIGAFVSRSLFRSQSKAFSRAFCFSSAVILCSGIPGIFLNASTVAGDMF